MYQEQPAGHSSRWEERHQQVWRECQRLGWVPPFQANSVGKSETPGPEGEELASIVDGTPLSHSPVWGKADKRARAQAWVDGAVEGRC